jgi:hypothetical protein
MEPSLSFQIAQIGSSLSASASVSTSCVGAFEAAFNRLKDFRRIATRYDKLARNYLASVCLAAALVWWVGAVGVRVDQKKRTSGRCTHAHEALLRSLVDRVVDRPGRLSEAPLRAGPIKWLGRLGVIITPAIRGYSCSVTVMDLFDQGLRRLPIHRR